MPRPPENSSMPADRGDVVIAGCQLFWPSACLYWNLSMSIPRGHNLLALGRLISSPGVEIGGATIHLDALERYRKTKVHFRGLRARGDRSADDTRWPTFDQDFRKFADVRVRKLSNFSFGQLALDPL